MKKVHKQKLLNLFLYSILTIPLHAQEAQKPELLVNPGYYISDNGIQYLQVRVQIKANNKLQPVKNVVLQLYLDSLSAENLITKVRTDEKGIAKASLTVSLKEKWISRSKHKFIAVTEATRKEDETIAELEINRVRITIDTANAEGAKTVVVQVMALENNHWIPAKDVEVKIGVRRLGGDLKIGEKEAYTTDSLGQINAEFKLDSLPAINAKGDIVLVAKIEDNDKFGNLSINKTVPWGTYYKHESNFNQRSLWATRLHTPIWLLIMAYSIIAMVWGVIIYLVIQLVKIKKIGREKPGSVGKPFHMSGALTTD